MGILYFFSHLAESILWILTFVPLCGVWNVIRESSIDDVTGGNPGRSNFSIKGHMEGSASSAQFSGS